MAGVRVQDDLEVSGALLSAEKDREAHQPDADKNRAASPQKFGRSNLPQQLSKATILTNFALCSVFCWFMTVLPCCCVLLMMQTTECAISRFDAEDLLPKKAVEDGVQESMVIGAYEKMKDVNPSLRVDLSGLWWLEGNYFPEVCVSFAGSSGHPPYPARVQSPANHAGHVAWQDTYFARVIMFYHAFFTPVDEMHKIDFKNATDASESGMVQDGFYFGSRRLYMQRVHDHEWRRSGHTMRRIIFGNGKPHPFFWENFLDYYTLKQPNRMMLAFSTDSRCLRRCQYFLSCAICRAIC